MKTRTQKPAPPSVSHKKINHITETNAAVLGHSHAGFLVSVSNYEFKCVDYGGFLVMSSKLVLLPLALKQDSLSLE